MALQEAPREIKKNVMSQSGDNCDKHPTLTLPSKQISDVAPFLLRHSSKKKENVIGKVANGSALTACLIT